MGDVVLFLEILEVVVGGDLTEFVIFFKELGDFSLVSRLINLVSAVELLDVVHQSQ